ncbi:site-specific integrase [Paenibacillus alginolyticus]|uniref:tyrosine-type recombinase/integrase n=1 Tax=Paenibacillus alginolyticus TaxID=59839 RepID=UPI0003F9DF45|nr:site-specific integrase [Paenibacillus alginolyticus]MCY9669050.1 site-specific integrase [Paenibacillus alginolyticus]
MKNLYKDIQLFILTSNVSENSKATHQNNLSDFAQFLATLKETKLEEVHLEKIFTLSNQITGKVLKHNPINSEVLDHYFRSKQGFSYYKLTLLRKSLGAFFKFLEREYQFPNPTRQMDFNFEELKPVKRPIKTLSRHDVLRFLHTLVSKSRDYYRDLALFCLIFATGCRISEILSLRMFQIDFTHGFINLGKTKSGKSQTVVLKHGIEKGLEFYCKQLRLANSDYLFQNKNSLPLQYATVRDLFRNYLKLANIPENHLHITRHTFATHLFENGSDIAIIQQLLRHKDKHTTVGYVHSNYVRNYGIKVKHNQVLYEKLVTEHSL